LTNTDNIDDIETVKCYWPCFWKTQEKNLGRPTKFQVSNVLLGLQVSVSFFWQSLGLYVWARSRAYGFVKWNRHVAMLRNARRVPGLAVTCGHVTGQPRGGAERLRDRRSTNVPTSMIFCSWS